MRYCLVPLVELFDFQVIIVPLNNWHLPFYYPPKENYVCKYMYI